MAAVLCFDFSFRVSWCVVVWPKNEEYIIHGRWPNSIKMIATFSANVAAAQSAGRKYMSAVFVVS